MSSYVLQEPTDTVIDNLGQSPPVETCLSLNSEEAEKTLRKRQATARARSVRRAIKLFRDVATNYVIRQHIFSNLPPTDISNFIYAVRVRMDMGARELERHLHPMRYFFTNAELDIISRRVADGYAVVLWGRDLKELVDVMENHFTRQGGLLCLRPQFRTIPRLQFAITFFPPPGVLIANKSTLPDFGHYAATPLIRRTKSNYPTPGSNLTYYGSNTVWDGRTTVLPLTQYVPVCDLEGVSKYVIGGCSHIMYYINVHEKSFVLRKSHGRMAEITRVIPCINGPQRCHAWEFEISVTGS